MTWWTVVAYSELRDEDPRKVGVLFGRGVPVRCELSGWECELVHLCVAKIHKGITNGINAELRGLNMAAHLLCL